ncbi:MAG: hypothetical protein Ta2B_06260 [Termitinemataceae bacterium]|nr:MAG: hypothetical protein Ta2B_06260 [Termitinemataceae bacterium]
MISTLLLSQRDIAAKSASGTRNTFAGERQSKGFCPAFEPEKMRQKARPDLARETKRVFNGLQFVAVPKYFVPVIEFIHLYASLNLPIREQLDPVLSDA